MSDYHTLGVVQIPRGLVWSDEFSWNPIETVAERSITGDNIIDVGEKTGGRPITLQGSESAGWLTRSVLTAIYAMANALDAEGDPVVYTLTLADGRSFSVIFAPGKTISANPIGRPELPTEPNPYVCTIPLETVG